MMNTLKLNTLLLLGIFFILSGCKDTANEPVKESTDPQPIDFNNTSTSNSSEPAQNTSGAYHYTCSNGCAGGAASAVNCANCGTLLVHNQAYHSNNNKTTTTTPTDPFNQSTTTAGQNAAGVWHYSCNNGCAGGAAAAGNCSSCGEALAHNSAYHQ